MPIQTRGQFKASVLESLENDPRFNALLDEACTRAVDDIFAESNFGNFKYTTLSETGRGEYDLPEGTMYVNHATYDGVVLDRITFDEFLIGKSWFTGVRIRWGAGRFVVKDNRLLEILPAAGDDGKEITLYVTLADTGFDDTNDAEDMPLQLPYTRAAWHGARGFLLYADGQTERANNEEALCKHYLGQASRRLNGSVKTKVKRIY